MIRDSTSAISCLFLGGDPLDFCSSSWNVPVWYEPLDFEGFPTLHKQKPSLRLDCSFIIKLYSSTMYLRHPFSARVRLIESLKSLTTDCLELGLRVSVTMTICIKRMILLMISLNKLVLLFILLWNSGHTYNVPSFLNANLIDRRPHVRFQVFNQHSYTFQVQILQVLLLLVSRVGLFRFPGHVSSYVELPASVVVNW